MDGMGLFPIAEGKQRHEAEAGADPVISPARSEVGAMSAVVLNDEQPHVQPSGRQR
jgi:hypothetical protein